MYNSIKPYDSFIKRSIFILVLTNLISAVFALYFPVATKILIDKLIGLNNINYIIYWIFISILATIIINAFNFYFVEYFGDKVSTNLSNKIRLKLIKKVLSLPVYTYNKLDQGMLFNTIISETNIAAVSFLNNRILFITKLIQIFIYLVIIFYINWKISLLTIIVIPFFIFLSVKNKQDFNDSINTERKNIDNVVEIFNIIIKNKKQIQSFNKNDYFSKEFNNSLDVWGLSRIKYNFYYTFIKTLPNLINQITILLVYGIGAFFIIKNKLTLGTLLLLTQICILLFQELTTITSIKIDVKNAKPIFERINTILFINVDKNDIYDKSVNRQKIINLKDVDIYINNQENLLFHIKNMILDKKGLYIISAQNGTGKTYFLDCLCGMAIGISTDNRIEIPDFNDIGYLTHPNFFIEGSVLKNIFFEELNDEYFIKDMKNVFDLNLDFLNKDITLHPLNLSLGEQQKISLMRFFWLHRDKSIWLLDEPTTNLDLDTIYRLRDYIMKCSTSKIIIIISHDTFFNDIAKKQFFIENKMLSDQ